MVPVLWAASWSSALVAQAPVASAQPALHEKSTTELRRDLLRRARRHLRREDPWPAVLDLQRLATVVPDPLQDADLQQSLARTYLMLGHARAALAHVRHAGV